jgi:hypothetical protein
MIPILVTCATTAALTFALTIALITPSGVAGAAASTGSQAFVPPCAHASYAADGNMDPLFCVIDNPIALRYFAPMAKRTFALGPNATQAQVAAALIADFKHGGTEPTLCSIYRLAAWRNHWSYGGSIAVTVGARLSFPSGWCTEPLFHFTDLD